ncbi:hypothetical protein [Pseudalkalibacillus sp. SCS-8]|uniref:hypothetical protein n=1 Tax=Pseudalkalibacillus nanhaiensis TaxID=3115291 RepID=UPI0032DB47F6
MGVIHPLLDVFACCDRNQLFFPSETEERRCFDAFEFFTVVDDGLVEQDGTCDCFRQFQRLFKHPVEVFMGFAMDDE